MVLGTDCGEEFYSQGRPPRAGTRKGGQLAGRGTEERTPLLKTVMFCGVMTVLNERKHYKMVSRSVQESVSLILGRIERQGLIALHRAKQVGLV